MKPLKYSKKYTVTLDSQKLWTEINYYNGQIYLVFNDISNFKKFKTNLKYTVLISEHV